jgi:hypothetical protein
MQVWEGGMSDTPRTDEAEFHTGAGFRVTATFCRQLERELTLQKRHIEVINGTIRATLGMEDGRDCFDEIQRLKECAARYEYLRKLNPIELSDLWKDCLRKDLLFDAEVDRRRTAK